MAGALFLGRRQRSELDCLALDDFRLSLDDAKLAGVSLYDALFDVRDNGRETKQDVQVPLNACMYLELSNAFFRQVDGLYQRKFIFCGGEHRNPERLQEAFNVMLVKINNGNGQQLLAERVAVGVMSADAWVTSRTEKIVLE
ncbi:hypothetical protein GTA08_BOTSDO08697 [Botryosphaeria dothidea]|uniref:Uncharacterized protein n=1 Tax=Botryosphaeria dothidea TaxID=55169 RepID=A0A8H4N530_9PEZI|nr:hypothetical protein GTA08_BOTSDO08697 [Botryosphaeria dothidea]